LVVEFCVKHDTVRLLKPTSEMCSETIR